MPTWRENLILWKQWQQSITIIILLILARFTVFVVVTALILVIVIAIREFVTSRGVKKIHCDLFVRRANLHHHVSNHFHLVCSFYNVLVGTTYYNNCYSLDVGLLHHLYCCNCPYIHLCHFQLGYVYFFWNQEVSLRLSLRSVKLHWHVSDHFNLVYLYCLIFLFTEHGWQFKSILKSFYMHATFHALRSNMSPNIESRPSYMKSILVEERLLRLCNSLRISNTRLNASMSTIMVRLLK